MCRTCTSMWVPFSMPTSGRCSLKSLFHRLWTPFLSGVRTSTSASWMVVLAAEMLGGKSGIGFLITRGMDSGDYALCLLSMVCIGLVGALLAIITQLLERMVCPWTAKKSN